MSGSESSNPEFQTDGESESNQEEEDWVEYMKRSTRESGEKMQTFKIKSCIETETNYNGDMPGKVAAHSEGRWTRKAAVWKNPSVMIALNAMNKEHATTQSNDMRGDNTWLEVARDISN